MKVLHVNAGLENGGGLTHIVNLLTEAKKQGENYELLTLAEGPVAEAAKKAGITTHILGANGRYDLASLKKLKNFINEGGYDIVHTHGARANLYLSLIAKKVKAKWCVTVHSDPFLDFEGRGFIGTIFTKLNLRALRKADCVFAVTQRFANLIVKKGQLNPKKVHVIYNGIFFHDDSEIPAKYEHTYFNIVNVARTEKVKGQELLLKALKKMDDPHVRLYIAGDGSKLEELKALTRQLDIAPQVTFNGFMTQKQLKNLYRRMNLAVLTSYSESFPLVLLEASDNQVPILSTDVGDIQMMIPDEEHGFVAKIGDVTSITAQLKKAVDMPEEKLEEIAIREKEYLSSNFSIKNQLHSIKAFYEEL